jgi:hypothetical protein
VLLAPPLLGPCRFGPKPIVARCPEDILAARGVKPTLSPNLEVLATVEALRGQVKRLLFIGVGCQVCWGGGGAGLEVGWGGGGGGPACSICCRGARLPSVERG